MTLHACTTPSVSLLSESDDSLDDNLPDHWRTAIPRPRPVCPFASDIEMVRQLVRDLRAFERACIDVGRALVTYERQWPANCSNLHGKVDQRLTKLCILAQQLERKIKTLNRDEAR